jgi:hypothetical protein
MSYQFDLFDDGDPLLGLEVHLPYRCKCGGGDLLVVGTARRAPHGARPFGRPPFRLLCACRPGDGG